jgi:hypothetical protein
MWFHGFDWDRLEKKEITPPYLPDIKVDNFDPYHVNNQEWKDADAVRSCEQTLRRDSV